jgi:transketolase
MEKNKDIWLLTGGVGYGVLDAIQRDFPNRFIDCEASEQAMVDIAVGLAMSRKIPFVYAITPHLYRAFESFRNYLDHEKIPVKIIGIGRGRDYGKLGFSHWSEDDLDVFGLFKNITILRPETKEEISRMIEEVVKINIPCYINLRR